MRSYDRILEDIQGLLCEELESDEARGRMEVYRSGATRYHPYDIEKVHHKLLGKIESYKIYTVDGVYLRLHVDIDFCEGGNPGRYSYVPKDEIWVEDGYGLQDTLCTLFHEIVECRLMIRDGLDYSHAHDLAAEHELKLRQRVEKKGISFEDLEALASKGHADALQEYKRSFGAP